MNELKPYQAYSHRIHGACCDHPDLYGVWCSMKARCEKQSEHGSLFQCGKDVTDVTEMAEYIEREKLLSDVDAAMENAGMGYVIGQTMKRYIKRVPSADVAPVRHGRWIQGNGYAECSECNTIGSPHWKCCPVCTAMMDLEVSDGQA